MTSFAVLFTWNRPASRSGLLTDDCRFATEAEAERHGRAVGDGFVCVVPSQDPVNARRPAGEPVSFLHQGC